MTIAQMRVDLSRVYPYSLSKSWKNDILYNEEKYPDERIYAMYKNFEQRDAFRKAEQKKEADLKLDGIQLKMDI